MPTTKKTPFLTPTVRKFTIWNVLFFLLLMLIVNVMFIFIIVYILHSGIDKRIGHEIDKVLTTLEINDTIINIIDFNYSLENAVESPRLHFEDGVVHIEPDLPEEITKSIGKHYKVHKWKEKDMYFGGVHCVSGEMQGCGDSRRGGSFLAVE